MKRVIAIVAGLALGVGIMLGVLQPWKKTPKPAVPSPAPPSKSNNLDLVQQMIDEGRFQDAHEAIQSEFKAAWPDARAWALAGLIALRTGDVKVAQEDLAHASKIDPDLFEIPLFQGHLEMLLGDRSAARRSYTEALKRRPGDAKALAGRAAARFELGEHAGAVEDATAAIAKEPDALFTRAAAYGALKRSEDAVRDWTAYLAKRPKDSHAWMNRGNEHGRMGNKAAAVADWNQAVLLDPRLKEQLEPLIR
ncbi:MAG TPA: tetratricopeptide repeat protein [Planctomycetota bacterium]|nr:tetratricopeptide repeat protein [Planctomycetota bacterium]